MDSFEEIDGVQLQIDDITDIEHVNLLIRPCYGYYANQECDKQLYLKCRFEFHVTITEFFPFEPYKVRLLTPVMVTALFDVDFPSKY